jgi:Zn-ribbon RNA-binding protein
MSEEKLLCSSCKKRITNNTGVARFMCPNCLKTEIIRCKSCRQNVAKYKCSSCDFTGPN